MWKKIRDNSWLLLALGIVFILVYLFFTLAHPVVPYDSDDWRYLGQFRRPLPDMNQWNPSRVLPEVITPLAGYFAAYVVTPLLGSYIDSFTVTVALTLSALSAALFYVLYRLFHSLGGNKTASVLTSLLILCLYFVFLKTRVNSQYLLYSYNLNTIYAYTVPNVINSILVCILMRYSAAGKDIGINGAGTRVFVIFAVVIYFAIFSILFASVIVAVYCFFELVTSVVKKESLGKKLAYIVILAAFLIYCYYELSGERVNSDSGGTTNYSILSMEFVNQLMVAWWNFQGLFQQANMAIFSGTLGIIFLALTIFAINREEDKDKPLVRMGFISMASFIVLIPALVFVGGKSGPGYCSLTHTMYSVFFYYFLCTGFSLIYILSKISKAVIVLPFLLVLLFIESTNSGWPFIDQSSYSINYFERGMTTKQKKRIASDWIEAITAADEMGAEAAVIQVPMQDGPDWPVSFDWFDEAFAHTLRTHGVISRELPIILEPNWELLMTIGGAPGDSGGGQTAEEIIEETAGETITGEVPDQAGE
jgi:hypothetical protein